MNVDKQHFRANVAFYFVFILILGLNLYLFSPYFHTFVFAAIISGSVYPLFIKFEKWSKFPRKWSSLFATVAVFLTILIPLSYIIFQVSREAVSLYSHILGVVTEQKIQDFIFGEGFFARTLKSALDLFNIDMGPDEIIQLALNRVKIYSGFLLNYLNGWVGDTFQLIWHFLIMVLAIYGLFLYGQDLKSYVFKLSPLPDNEEQEILDRFNQMNFVTMVGNGIGGLIQGGLAGMAFMAIGLPSVMLWTTIMVLLAFIPLVGISFVTVPTSIYLMITGRLGEGIFLFIFSAAVGLLVENWFKPKFIGDKVKVNGLLVFFYILAGMSTFGMAGIFYGPLLCVIFSTLANLFLDKYIEGA